MKRNMLAGILLLSLLVTSIGLQAQHRNSNKRTGRQPAAPAYPTRSASSVNNDYVGAVNRNNVQFKNERTVVTRQQLSHPERVAYNNRNYNYSNGHFYVEQNGRYMQTRPIAGLRIKTLPAGYSQVRFGNNLYFSFAGVYYSPVNGYYEVVNPVPGTIVQALPADYEKIVYNGRMYYEYNGVLYDKVRTGFGNGYQVVGFLS